jgi:hypothetical protein
MAKKKPTGRTKVLPTIRVTPDERAQVMRTAKAEGKPYSRFARERLGISTGVR